MQQWLIFGNGKSYAALYFQRFFDEEDTRYFHCHRHRLMVSIPFGIFREERRLPTGETYFKTHYPLFPYVMTSNTVHRIDWWPRWTFSLWLQIGNKHEWGFIERHLGEYIPFDEHIPKARRV